MKKEKNSWKDITLEEYLTIIELQKEHPEDNMKFIIEYLYDVILDDLPIVDSMNYIKKLEFLSEPIDKVKLKSEYNINDNKYELNIIPQSFTYSQFMDWVAFSKEDKEDKLIDLLSVVMIPKGRKYSDGYDMEKVKDDIRDMYISDVNAIATFFLSLSKNYLKVLTHYLPKLMKKGKMPKEKQAEIMTKVNQLMLYYPMQ